MDHPGQVDRKYCGQPAEHGLGEAICRPCATARPKLLTSAYAKTLVLAPLWRYPRDVPSVQIKNVPPDVHSALRRRAAAAGQSLQEYLLARLTEDAREESLDEVLARAGGRAGGSVPLSFAAEQLRDERERH
jgi:antitoxin FitA